MNGGIAEQKVREKGDPCQLKYQALQFLPTTQVCEGQVKGVADIYMCTVCMCLCFLGTPDIFIQRVLFLSLPHSKVETN